MEELEKAKAAAPKPVSLEGSVAVPMILKAEFSDNDLFVDSDDPVKLGSGASVQLFPTDGGGFTHKDTGMGKRGPISETSADSFMHLL